ncbi:TetR/AcrR family transcriptional regulator [Acidicapsa acidisoli]|uniref:TetR/AcrR family transcriptional regulator n=1 Tax=Acidicapsa acidisoli TaxID=1615681 RepID=UPI0021DF9CE7|nr:TetR/AcrR family transcriptional regulator [Acidicapsa acidisoli]
MASLLDAAGSVFGELGYHAATTNAIAAEAKVSPATLYQFFPDKEAIADALVARYAMDLAKEERAADTQKLASASLEEAIRQVTGVVIEFHRKHPAFRTLYAEAPLSKDTVEQKRLLVQTFIDIVSKVLSTRNPKLDKRDALWSAEIVLTALIGFLPALAGRKASDRSRMIDALNQMLARYLEPVLKPPIR